MKKIRPRRSRSMPRAARRATRNDPVRLVSMTADQSSSLIRSSNVSRVMPALATRTSTGPCFSETVSTASSTWSASVTSQRTPSIPSGASPERSVIATSSPAATKALAMASPMPRLPPVTITDLPTVTPLGSGVLAVVHTQHCVTLSATLRYSETSIARGTRKLLAVLQPEAELHGYLIVRHRVVHDVASDLRDLEPVQVPQRLSGPGD